MAANEWKEDFPTLKREVNGHPLVYLDSAATSQKPQSVIDAVNDYYTDHNANVHRCIHTLAAEATDIYDRAHKRFAQLINAESWREIVFTKNATEAANLIAYGYGMKHLSTGDEILLTELEHHSNIVPWQQVAERTGATLRYAGLDDEGHLDMTDVKAKITESTAIVAVSQLSNVLGTMTPIKEIAAMAHEQDAVIVVDGAQSVPHMPVDVQDLDVDFLFCSAHKMMGPTGLGMLYGKETHLDAMDPFLFGGDMISRVEKNSAEWNELPWKFEAGTPHMAGAAGLIPAIEYLESIGMSTVEDHGKNLAIKAYDELQDIDEVTVYGPRDRLGLVSFTVDGAHPHDLSTLLNEQGIAVRGGHHCAQPLSEVLGVGSTTRASFYIYNTMDDIQTLVAAVSEAADLFN